MTNKYLLVQDTLGKRGVDFQSSIVIAFITFIHLIFFFFDTESR